MQRKRAFDSGAAHDRGTDDLTGSGTAAAGFDPLVFTEFCPRLTTATFGVVDDGRMFVVKLAAPMYVRALAMEVGATGAGTHKWGLFDATAGAGAAVQVVGGSGAIGSTGYFEMAATGAPVLVPAGVYFLVFGWPAANPATLRYAVGSPTNLRASKVKNPLVFGTPLDLVTGWAGDLGLFFFAVVGDLDAAGNAW